MKRQITVLIAIMIIAGALLALVGCGIIGEEYTVLEWYASYFETYFPRWMDDFAAMHPEENIRFEFRAMVGEAAQKVYTMLISNTLSDIIVVGTGTRALLIDNQALEPIPEGFIDTEQYMPLALSLDRYEDGSLSAIPFTIGIRPFMYFNVDILEEVGADVDEIPGTFDEYHEWAAQFLRWRLPDGSIVNGKLPPEKVSGATRLRRPLLIQRGHILSVYPFLLAYLDPMVDEDGHSDNSLDDFLGGPPSNRPFRFDTPEVIAGMTEWRDFFLSDTGAIADGDADRIQGLTAGNYASVEGGNWIFSEVFSVNMTTTSLPSAEGKPLRLPIGVTAQGVSRQSPNKELAMKFARYISEANQLLDGYYGHGYLPSRWDAWEAIRAFDEEDIRIRERFLSPFAEGNADFIGQPRIRRTYHDRMTLEVYVPFRANVTLGTWSSLDDEPDVPEHPGEEILDEPGELDPSEEVVAETFAERHDRRLQQLASDVARMTGKEVTVVLQGTPEEMVSLRSVVQESPVENYLPHLEHGVYVPVHRLWERLQGEVIVRMAQFVTHPDPSRRMTPEEAARWAQEEAEAIAEGRK